MKGAGLHQQEVGDERTHLGDVLDATDKVAVGRIELLVDRRAFVGCLAIADDDVDHVAAEPRIAGGVGRLLDDLALLAALGQEQPYVAHEILAGCLEVGLH